MDLNDRDAIERAQQGDSYGFRVLVNRYGRSVFGVAFRMVGNEQDAEDVVQETFLRAFKQLHRYDGRASFRPWLYRIATNLSLDLIRSRKVRKEQSVSGTDDEGESPISRLAAEEPSPERLTRSAEIAGSVQSALELLTDMERSAFVLRHYEDYDIDQIADVLGVRPNAAKQSVYRAVEKLRRALLPAWGVAK